MPFGPPLNCQALSQGKHAGLGHRARYHIWRAGPGIGGNDVQDDTANTLGDPTLAGGERALSSTVQHDIEDRIHRAMGERFGSGNKVTSGIIDQHIERSTREGGVHQALNSFGRANVDDMSSNFAGE